MYSISPRLNCPIYWYRTFHILHSVHLLFNSVSIVIIITEQNHYKAVIVTRLHISQNPRISCILFILPLWCNTVRYGCRFSFIEVAACCWVDLCTVILPGLNWAAVEVRSWMTKYLPLFYMYAITYPCYNNGLGLPNLCYWNSQPPPPTHTHTHTQWPNGIEG